MAVTHRDSSPEPSEEPDSPMESNDDDEEEEEVEEVDEVEEIEEEEEEEVEEAVEEEDEEADEEEAKGSDDEEIEEVEEEEEEEEVEVEEGDEEEAKVHEDEEEEVEEEEEEVDEVEEEEVEEEEEEEHEADEEETNVHEDEEMDEVEEEEEEAKVHEDKKVDKGEEEKEADKEEAKDSIENQDSEAHGEKLRPVSSNTGSFERNPASPSNSARIETADNKNAFDISAADVKSEVQDTHVSSEEKEHAVSLVDEKVIDVSSEKKVSKEDSALVRNFYLEANETHQPFLSSEKSIGLEDTAPLEAPKKELDDARKSDVILETEASHLHLRSDMKIQDNSSSLSKPTPQQRPRSSSPAPLKAPKKVLADVRKFDGVLEKEASHLHLRSDTKMQDDLSLSSKLTPQRRPRSSSPALEAPKKELADVRKSDGILEKEASHLHLRSDTKMQDDLSSSSKLTPRRRPRSSSPGSLLESLSKKPAMVCAFYAKGWCVRGKSCRFLHQKEESRENLVESSGKGVVLDAAGSNSETALKSQLQIQRDLVEQYGGKTLIRDEYKSPKFDYMDDRRSNSGHFLSRDSSLAIGSVGPEHRYYSSGSSMLPSKYLNNDPFDRRAENSSFQSSYQSYRSSYQSFSRPKVELIPPLKIPSNLPDSLKRRIAALEHSWEPSMPFRPSYHYGQSLTSSCNQYDPLIDSIEPRNIERTVSGHSANGEQGHNVQKSSFHQPHDVILDKSTNLIVAPENTAVDGGDGSNKPKEEKVPVVDHEVESANVNGADDKLSKELKAVRIFRVALVDFVKDLVKPFWREGRLSKDVHKTIVKKAVEKVLDSLQPQQVPNDSDSINEFLSISRPKLRKLVEGYVERYTKS